MQLTSEVVFVAKITHHHSLLCSVFKSSTKKIKDFLGKMNNSTRDKLNAAKKHVGKAKKAEKVSVCFVAILRPCCFVPSRTDKL